MNRSCARIGRKMPSTMLFTGTVIGQHGRLWRCLQTARMCGEPLLNKMPSMIVNQTLLISRRHVILSILDLKNVQVNFYLCVFLTIHLYPRVYIYIFFFDHPCIKQKNPKKTIFHPQGGVGNNGIFRISKVFGRLNTHKTPFQEPKYEKNSSQF